MGNLQVLSGWGMAVAVVWAIKKNRTLATTWTLNCILKLDARLKTWTGGFIFFCSQCIYTFHCRLAWNGPGIVASETFTFGAKSHLHSQLVIVAENVSLVTGKTRSWHVNIDRWSSMIIIGVTLVKICQSLVQKININQSPWWYTYTWSVGRCFARQYEAYSSHICQLKI